MTLLYKNIAQKILFERSAIVNVPNTRTAQSFVFLRCGRQPRQHFQNLFVNGESGR